jgi:hypothetical protein
MTVERTDERTVEVETCAVYTGDLPEIEDTSPKCETVAVVTIPESACEEANGEAVHERTPGLGPIPPDDPFFDRGKYLGCVLSD